MHKIFLSSYSVSYSAYLILTQLCVPDMQYNLYTVCSIMEGSKKVNHHTAHKTMFTETK